MLTPEFFMLSANARSSYAFAFILAARAEDGRPMTATHLQVLSAIPLPKQELALKELEDAGFVRFIEGGFEVPMFAEMQRPRSSSERMQALRERDVYGDEQSDGESDGSVTKKNRRTEYTPGKANALPPPGVETVPSRRRIEPVRVDDSFGDLEPLVVSVLALDAAKRKDGKIADTVVDSLRQKLARHRERHGVDAVRHGLEVALDKGIGVDYACGVAKRHKPGEAFGHGPVEPERAVIFMHPENR